MTKCSEMDCDADVDEASLQCEAGHSNVGRDAICSHGRSRNGPCIDCQSQVTKKCPYGHLMLNNDQRCATCDGILRSQLLSKNQTIPAPTVSGNETMWFSKSNSIQPPAFQSSKEQYKTYLSDLVRWQTCTSVPAARHADIIMINIPQNHKLKERLEQEIQNGAEGDGIKAIKAVYGEDEIYESFLAFRNLEDKQRKTGQDIIEYTLEWECVYNKAKTNGALKEGQLKAFQYLATCNMDNNDLKLIFNDMTFTSKDKDPEALFNQAKRAVKNIMESVTFRTQKQIQLALFIRKTKFLRRLKRFLLEKGGRLLTKGREKKRSIAKMGITKKENGANAGYV